MRKRFKIPKVLLLILVISPGILCQNGPPQPSGLSTFLQNLETDITGFFSKIPFPRLSALRRVFVDPILGIYGNAVETLMDSRRRSSIGRLDKIRFLLYSDRASLTNESYTRLIPEDDYSLKIASFTAARPIKILIHGFQASGFYEFPQKTKNEYLMNTNFNVIAVDWGPLSYPPLGSIVAAAMNYPSAINNMMFVSRRISDLIVALYRTGVIRSPEEVHVIGFSLGAHIAGNVGYNINRRLGSKLSRITALEPASPLLETLPLEMRIDSSDANFVDAIHSSRLAMYNAVGHADFYPNGGRIQSECYDGFNAFENPQQAIEDVRTQCSHEYGYEVFSLSIRNRDLRGCRCNSWAEYRTSCKSICPDRAVMGEYCPPTTRGQYFLETQLPENYNRMPN